MELGLSPQFLIIVELYMEYKKKAGEKVFPNLTIESINVFEVLELCGKGKYEELTNYLMKAIHNLIASGVDFIALTGNTPHIVFGELQKRSSVPLVSGIEATCNEAKDKSYRE
ncbi:aspartate/glutamate racemase family protein [uncultured Anaeromusa sp.]|uniref:aspartate/glutamate racemase family protein n=1 Tax=uncultured Anaeromusa sp. TaxID=673273 RepID=UPI0029C87052|nr:aspartate/glutamate racemase family protein [uncultured Anaeromusa sp.]